MDEYYRIYDEYQDSSLNEGILFDKNNEIANYLKRFPEFDIMNVALSTSIASHLGTSIIVKSFPFWKRGIPATYDMKQNKIYVNSSCVEPVISLLKSINPFNKEKKRFESVLEKTNLKLAIGGICYYGIHLYNIKNKGILTNNQLNMKFYRGYFSRMLYEKTKLTTISNKVSELFYIPYINIIREFIEARSYVGGLFTSTQEKQFNYIISQLNEKMMSELEAYGFDKTTIDSYAEWFKGFMSDFKLVYNNRRTVVMHLDDDFMLRQNQTNALKVLAITSLYNTYKNVGGRADVEHDRFPTSAFRELYSTAEPLAQIMNSLVKQNKLKDNEELQGIASKGLSYLS